MLDSKLELFCFSYGHGSKVAAIDLGSEQRQIGFRLMSGVYLLYSEETFKSHGIKKKTYKKKYGCAVILRFFAFTQAGLEIRNYVRLFLNMCVTKEKRGTVEI